MDDAGDRIVNAIDFNARRVADHIIGAVSNWEAHIGELPTLRDRFAMAALTGMLACPDSSGSFESFAGDAFKYADAMMARRGEVKP